MCIVFYQLRRKGTKNNANTRIFLLLCFFMPFVEGARWEWSVLFATVFLGKNYPYQN